MKWPHSIFEMAPLTWLLAALPVLAALQWWSIWRKHRALAKLAGPAALPLLLPPRPRWRWLTGLLFSLGMMLLIAGAASPFWGEDPRPALVAGRDIVFVLDMSRSMTATDAPPNRFERAPRALLDLLPTIEQQGGHRLALVVYASDAQIVCPLTHDYRHIVAKLEELDIDYLPANLRAKPGSVSGTRIGIGIRKALECCDEKYRGYQDILLLSDGDDPVADNEWQEGLNAARTADVPIHSVGLGNPDRDALLAVPGRGEAKTRLHEHPLRELAHQTGGGYLAARIEEPRLAEFFQRQIGTKKTTTQTDDAPPQPHARYVWFYLGAFVLLGGWWLVKKEE